MVDGLKFQPSFPILCVHNIACNIQFTVIDRELNRKFCILTPLDAEVPLQYCRHHLTAGLDLLVLPALVRVLLLLPLSYIY